MAKAKQRNTTSSAVKRREQVRQQRQARPSGVQSQAASSKGRKRAIPKRSPWLLIGGTLVLVAAIVGIFIFLARQSGSNSGGQTRTPTEATTFAEVTNVDPGLLSRTGTGGLPNPFKLTQGSPSLLIGPTGKPEVFYWGGEFCPLCAAERWSVVVAMSRFGTFHTLNEMASASDDSYPNTSTFTFYQSSYSSPYVDFVPVEAEDQQRASLQNPTPDEQKLVNTYDGPPYIDAQYAGGFPFMDVGNRYLILGPSYDPALLRTNPQDPNSQPLSQQEIASQLSTGNTLSKNILGAANYLTAAICAITKDQPSSVCSDPSIQQIKASLSQTGRSNATSGGSSLVAVMGPAAMDVRRKQGLF